jgi:RNA polymerase sigma factor (sigma-70 family)
LNTDPNTIAQDAAHDPRAFAVLYDLYFPRVYNYIRYRCRDPLTTDDLTAQVFERLLEKINHFSPQRGAFEAWLFTLVRNVVTDHFRRQRREGIARENDDYNRLDQQAATDPTPEDQLIRREGDAELLSAINRLDERARDLLGLRFGARLTNRQIAELTRLSESNVGVILYRALAELRTTLNVPVPVNSRQRNEA